jgi:ribosomal protein S18 acetylase RimI-like enzyme
VTVADGPRIRTATADDELPVRRVIDGAMLEVPKNLAGLIESEQVLVAVAERVVGALVLVQPAEATVPTLAPTDEASHIASVAVRRRRRGSGIGAALVRTAAERVSGPLTAEFRPSVRPFYESLGFEIREIDGESGERRLVGKLDETTD